MVRAGAARRAAARLGDAARTTTSRRTRTWCPNAWRRCTASTRGECDVLVVAATTALYRLAPPSYLAAFTFFLTPGRNARRRGAARAAGARRLLRTSRRWCRPASSACAAGSSTCSRWARRCPIASTSSTTRSRRIKTFDVDTQRTLYPVPEVRLLPAREFPLDDAGRTRFRSRFREVFEGDPSKSALYKDITQRHRARRHRVLPAAVLRATATLADYLPPIGHRRAARRRRGAVGSLLAGHRVALPAAARRQGAPAAAADRAVPAAGRVQRRDEAFRARSRLAPAMATGPTAPLPADAGGPPRRRSARRAEALPGDDVARVVAIVAESAGRRETMQQYFAEYDLHPAAGRGLRRLPGGRRGAPAAAGRAARRGLRTGPKAKLAFVTEAELYAGVVRRDRARGRASAATSKRWCATCPRCASATRWCTRSTASAATWACVTLDLGDGANEFLQLVYANDAKLYVPVSNLHLISRYSGASPEAAPLHELGSGQWEKAKKKAAQQAHDTAAELLNLYAQRAARQGHAFSSSRTTTRRSPKASASRKRATRRPRSRP